MDIAKIRKKAKAQAKPDKGRSESAAEQELAPGSGPAENEVEMTEVPAEQDAMELS